MTSASASASAITLPEWKFRIGNLPAAVRYYERLGFMGYDGVFGEKDVERLRAGFARAVESGKIDPNKEGINLTNEAILCDKVFEDYILDDRSVEILNAIFSEGIELHHSKIMRKLSDPMIGKVPWHQDFPYFPHTNFDLAALTILLDDVNEESGALRVVPGSHKGKVLSHCRDGEFAYECTEDMDFEALPVAVLTGRAGDVFVHHSLILHGSPPCSDGTLRRTIVYQCRPQDCVQISGAIWGDTGFVVRNGQARAFARFSDGTRIENRGLNGRLIDIRNKLAPDY